MPDSKNHMVEILYIEDNPTDAELTVRALKKKNLANKLMVIEDGAEAVEYLFAQGKHSERNIQDTPQVILLDLKLPKVSGLEILRMLRENEETRHVPVVVLTSSNEEQDIVESYELGVNSYIQKPVDFHNFAEVVSELGYYWLMLNKPPTD
jgi:two-component system response regulator